MTKIYISPSNHETGQNKCLRSGCYEDKHTRPIAEVCKKYLCNWSVMRINTPDQLQRYVKNTYWKKGIELK